MKNIKYFWLRITLLCIVVYHFIAGIAACYSQNLAIKIASRLYGVNIDLNGQTKLLIVYLGALAITFAVLMLFAMLDPINNKKIIYGGIVYFTIRAIHRILYWNVLLEHGTGVLENWIRLAVIIEFAVVLFICRPKECKKVISSE